MNDSHILDSTHVATRCQAEQTRRAQAEHRHSPARRTTASRLGNAPSCNSRDRPRSVCTLTCKHKLQLHPGARSRLRL